MLTNFKSFPRTPGDVWEGTITPGLFGCPSTHCRVLSHHIPFVCTYGRRKYKREFRPGKDTYDGWVTGFRFWTVVGTEGERGVGRNGRVTGYIGEIKWKISRKENTGRWPGSDRGFSDSKRVGSVRSRELSVLRLRRTLVPGLFLRESLSTYDFHLLRYLPCPSMFWETRTKLWEVSPDTSQTTRSLRTRKNNLFSTFPSQWLGSQFQRSVSEVFKDRCLISIVWYPIIFCCPF